MGQTTGQNMGALRGALQNVQGRAAPQQAQQGGYRGQKGNRPAPVGGSGSGIGDMVRRAQEQRANQGQQPQSGGGLGELFRNAQARQQSQAQPIASQGGGLSALVNRARERQASQQPTQPPTSGGFNPLGNAGASMARPALPNLAPPSTTSPVKPPMGRQPYQPVSLPSTPIQATTVNPTPIQKPSYNKPQAPSRGGMARNQGYAGILRGRGR